LAASLGREVVAEYLRIRAFQTKLDGVTPRPADGATYVEFVRINANAESQAAFDPPTLGGAWFDVGRAEFALGERFGDEAARDRCIEAYTTGLALDPRAIGARSM